jgi:DNA protecting protein DprA
MSFDAAEIAGLLVAGMTPRDIRGVLSSGLENLSQYARLDDTERQMLGLPSVDAQTFSHDEIWVAKPGDEGYPSELAEITSPPVVLFGRGQRSAVSAGVAVIGTRDITSIGAHVARAAVEGARRAGVGVISGLALGCDTAGHRGALDAGVPTVAVVAGGVDVVFPQDNAALADEIIAAGGAIVSEQPPGVVVTGQRLQARNRIITGMSHVVVPCEGSKTSRGTLGAVGTALAAHRSIVIGRVKPSWRHYAGAWLAERLAIGNQIDAKAFGWSNTVAARVESMPAAIANGVGDDAESIAELVEFAVLWARAEVLEPAQ